MSMNLNLIKFRDCPPIMPGQYLICYFEAEIVDWQPESGPNESPVYGDREKFVWEVAELRETQDHRLEWWSPSLENDPDIELYAWAKLPSLILK